MYGARVYTSALGSLGSVDVLDLLLKVCLVTVVGQCAEKRILQETALSSQTLPANRVFSTPTKEIFTAQRRPQVQAK